MARSAGHPRHRLPPHPVNRPERLEASRRGGPFPLPLALRSALSLSALRPRCLQGGSPRQVPTPQPAQSCDRIPALGGRLRGPGLAGQRARRALPQLSRLSGLICVNVASALSTEQAAVGSRDEGMNERTNEFPTGLPEEPFLWPFRTLRFPRRAIQEVWPFASPILVQPPCPCWTISLRPCSSPGRDESWMPS